MLALLHFIEGSFHPVVFCAAQVTFQTGPKQLGCFGTVLMEFPPEIVSKRNSHGCPSRVDGTLERFSFQTCGLSYYCCSAKSTTLFQLLGWQFLSQRNADSPSNCWSISHCFSFQTPIQLWFSLSNCWYIFRLLINIVRWGFTYQHITTGTCSSFNFYRNCSEVPLMQRH